MVNAANAETISDIRGKEALEYEQLVDDIKAILKTPAGFRFFKHFYKEGKLNDISMSGNSWTYFNEGHRNFAKLIFNEVCNADPNTAGKIIAEVTLDNFKELDND